MTREGKSYFIKSRAHKNKFFFDNRRWYDTNRALPNCKVDFKIRP